MHRGLYVRFRGKPFAQLSNAFVEGYSEIDPEIGTGTELIKPFGAALSETLVREPLTTPAARDLIIETRSPWTAIFSNGLRINDVHNPVSYLLTALKRRRLEIPVPDRSDTSSPDALWIWGAVKLTLYGPEETDWLNRSRHISV
jgi:hypothetical protein